MNAKEVLREQADTRLARGGDIPLGYKGARRRTTSTTANGASQDLRGSKALRRATAP